MLVEVTFLWLQEESGPPYEVLITGLTFSEENKILWRAGQGYGSASSDPTSVWSHTLYQRGSI